MQEFDTWLNFKLMECDETGATSESHSALLQVVAMLLRQQQLLLTACYVALTTISQKASEPVA